MIVQARFYAYDIFKNRPHPYAPSEDNKFNPLQKATYFNFMFFMMPLLLISGILYMYPSHFSSFIAFLGGLKVVALFHYVELALHRYHPRGGCNGSLWFGPMLRRKE